MEGTFCLDVFENPYAAPRPTDPQNPPSNKKQFQKPKNLRESLISPKVNVISPKVNALSPKVNVKYFKGIFEEFKIFEIFFWGSRSQGLRKYLTFCALPVLRRVLRRFFKVVLLGRVLRRRLGSV